MNKFTAFELESKKLSWKDLFKDEQELIEAMQRCPTDKSGKNEFGIVPKGFEYIESFKRYYERNGMLTPKQMTQLKRLAKNVYVGVTGVKAESFIAPYVYAMGR